MAILQGQEALDYINSGKGKYRLVQGDPSLEYKQKAAGSGNFFTNLLRSIAVDPFAKLGESAGVLTNKALNTVFNENIGYDPVYGGVLGQEATDKIEANPYLEGAKGAAGIAALGIPGGMGLKGGATAGAAAGGLGGFSASDGQDLIGSLGDVGKGALLGGAIGGAVGGIGSLGGKSASTSGVASKADDIYDDILKGDVTVAGNRTVDRVAQRATKARKALQSQGVQITDAETTALQAGKIIDDLSAQKAAILRESDYAVGTGDLMSKIQNSRIFKDNPSLMKSKSLEPYMEKITQRAKANGGSLSAEDVYSVIRDIDSELYNISSGTVAPKSTQANNALEGLRKTLSKEIKGVGDTAEIDKTLSPILDWLKTDSSYAIRRQSGSQQIVQTPIAPFSASLGTGKLRNVAKAKVAQGLESAPSITGKIPQIPAQASPLAGLLGSQMIMGAGQQTSPSQSAQTDPLESVMGATQPQVDPEQEKALLTLQLMQQTGDIKDAQALAELLFAAKYGSSAAGGQEVATGEVARKALTAQQAGYEALAALQADPSVTGKTQGIENIFNSLTGAANTATDYNNKIETFRTLFMSALGGASLTPQEIERFEKSLPRVTDSSERAQQKMESLLPYLDNLIYKGSGGATQEDLIQILGN